LGRAEKRIERAFVVVGVGESLAACETEVVRPAWREEAASDVEVPANSLTSESTKPSRVPNTPAVLAAGDASLPAMMGVGS
jgi:hypothetical protein